MNVRQARKIIRGVWMNSVGYSSRIRRRTLDQAEKIWRRTDVNYQISSAAWRRRLKRKWDRWCKRMEATITRKQA